MEYLKQEYKDSVLLWLGWSIVATLLFYDTDGVASFIVQAIGIFLGCHIGWAIIVVVRAGWLSYKKRSAK